MISGCRRSSRGPILAVEQHADGKPERCRGHVPDGDLSRPLQTRPLQLLGVPLYWQGTRNMQSVRFTVKSAYEELIGTIKIFSL